MTNPNIQPAQARTTAQIKFSDGQVLEGPLNTTIEEFIKAGKFPLEPMPVACLVNGQLRELTYHADRDLNVHVLTMADSDGMRVYRRSLSFLLIAVANELFPDAKILIDYGLNFGALYCEVAGRPSFIEEELNQIEARMRELVEANVPIYKERISISEAEALFESQDANDKLRLLKNRRKPYLTIYSLNDYRGYMHGYMVPSTSYLQWFALTPTEPGFTLRFPRRHKPTELLPLPDYSKLLDTFLPAKRGDA